MICHYKNCKSLAEQGTVLCTPHVEQRREYERRYRTRHAERVQLDKQTYRAEHMDTIRTQKLRRRQQVKLQVIDAYGGACRCCGETYVPFLTLNHINNDGKLHRAMAGTGQGVLYDLIRRGYPPIVEVLCANCHLCYTLGYECLPHVSA